MQLLQSRNKSDRKFTVANVRYKQNEIRDHISFVMKEESRPRNSYIIALAFPCGPTCQLPANRSTASKSRLLPVA